MLKLENVVVTLSKNTPFAMRVLNDLDLSVGCGEFVIIVGGNGCGKSTLLNTIAGHIRPDSGQILINNENIFSKNYVKRAASVAMVMQDPRLGTIANMTLAQNLHLAFMRGRAPGLCLYNQKTRIALFRDKLSLLNMGLENKLNALVGNLSGGQRQALSLIMAIIADYDILLLDEITAALDPEACENVMQIAARIVELHKKTAIMITHNMQHALRYGTRTLLMQNGTIVREYNYAARNDLSPVALAAAIGGVY